MKVKPNGIKQWNGQVAMTCILIIEYQYYRHLLASAKSHTHTAYMYLSLADICRRVWKAYLFYSALGVSFNNFSQLI